MSPILSPKKSVEGLIGGILGAGVLGLLYGLWFNSYVHEISKLPLIFLVICAVGAVPAVVGDLAASAIKRNNEVKDYGKLIPGHGGVMDRFDSMIFTAPIIYYLMQIML
jgi:phosphatidate cytidylyltransferase